MALGELMDYGMISNATVQITRLTAPIPSCGKSRRPSGYGTHPFGRVPSAPGLVDPEETDVPVEVGLQVPRRHPREAPKVALEPGARVIRHLHPLQVDRVVHVRTVGLAVESVVLDQRVVRPLEVVDQQRSGRYPAAHGLPHARRAGHPVAADDRDRVLVDVDGAQMLSFWRDRPRLRTCP